MRVLAVAGAGDGRLLPRTRVVPPRSDFEVEARIATPTRPADDAVHLRPQPAQGAVTQEALTAQFSSPTACARRARLRRGYGFGGVAIALEARVRRTGHST